MIERFETFTTNIASIYKNIVKIKKYEMNKIGLKGTHVTVSYTHLTLPTTPYV